MAAFGDGSIVLSPINPLSAKKNNYFDYKQEELSPFKDETSNDKIRLNVGTSKVKHVKDQHGLNDLQ